MKILLIGLLLAAAGVFATVLVPGLLLLRAEQR